MVTRSQRKKTIVLVMDRPEGGWNFTNKPKPLLEGLPDKVRGTSKKGKHVSSSSSSSAHSGEGLPVAGKAVSRSGRSTKEGFKRLPDKVRGTSKKGKHVSSSSSSSAHSGEGLPVAGKAVSRSGRSTKEGFKLEETEGEKAKQDALKQKFEVLCKVIKDVLGEKVEKVVVSDRVVDSPCCLVTGDDVSMAGYVSSQKTMEINPENSIIEVLRKRTDADKNDESVKYLVLLLFDLALLTYGFSLDEPKTFANRIHMLLKLGLGIDDDDIPALEEARN